MLCDAVLRHAQPAAIGEEEVHLRRRLGLGRELEHDPHTVDDQLLARARDLLGRCDQVGRRDRDRLAEPAVDVRPRSGLEQHTELVHPAPVHGEPGDHVLGDRLAQEVLGRDHAAATGVDVGLRGHAEHAAEVIDVRVGVDHGDHGPLAEMLVGQRQARRAHVPRS